MSRFRIWLQSFRYLRVRMKWLLPLALIGMGPAAHGVELTISNLAAAPGSSLLLPVAFAGHGEAVAGIQFDLQYDPGVMSVSATVGDAPRLSGKRLYLAHLSSTQIRVLTVGLNQNLIPDGILCTLFLSLNSNAPEGTYQLKLAEVSYTSPQSGAATGPGGDAAVTIQGSASQGTRLQANGVLSAASLLPGPIAPGELITLLGAGIGPPQPASSGGKTSLGDTTVLFDGIPAPLLYAGPNQINTVVPYAVAGKIATQVQIRQQQQLVLEFSSPVADAAPAIFTQDSSGVGPGAILNQDSTLNSPLNSADKGSIVSLFATGAGQTDPPGTDGQPRGAILPKPLLPVSVQIAGLDAQVLYAGAAPGLIAGMLQINCMIPQQTPSGFAIPVVITVGSATSQTSVTLSVN